ncbi:MAG: hypothetical protein IAG10_33445 [Planctomycetaceae bacterium]|nr:hypothetical protein [Planctomycetaceae bacterium]
MTDDSLRRRRKRRFVLPPNSLIAVARESREELQIQIAAGGPAVASFGWNSIGQFLFITAFGTLWYCVARDMGWTPLVICAVLWLVSVAVLCAWIRRLLESVHLQLLQDRLVVTRKLLGWRRTQEVILGSTPSVILEVSEWHGSTPKPTLCVKGSDGEARFGKMLNVQEKRWLVMRLRAFLELDPRTNLFAEPEGQADS